MAEVSIGYITPHFSWAEFACHDGIDVPDTFKPNARRLCSSVLEPLRVAWREPLIVICGYRSPQHNHAVAGAVGSKHMTAEAADIAPVVRAETPRLAALVEALIRAGQLPALGGFGVYPKQGWVHLDVRARPADGRIARWQGAGVGSEVV